MDIGTAQSVLLLYFLHGTVVIVACYVCAAQAVKVFFRAVGAPVLPPGGDAVATGVCLVSIAKSKHPVLHFLIVKPGANSAIIGFQ